MNLLVAVCVLVAICFATTDAITCYDCVYFDGHIGSDAQCQNNPSSDRTCNSVIPFSLNADDADSQSLKAYYQLNETSVSTETRESRQEWMVLCTKFTGTLDGKTVIARGCIQGLRELIGVCSPDVNLQIDGRYASNVQGCFCNGDRCNSANGVQATLISVIAVTVLMMYKFVAA